MRRALSLSLLVLSTSSACGAPPSSPTGGAPSNAAIVAPELGPRQTIYATEPTPDPVRGGPLAADLAERVRARLARDSLEGDGRMAEVATRVAVETQRRGKPVSVTELDAIARDAGFVGPAPTVFVVPRVDGAWDHLDEFLSMSPENVKFTRFGVAVIDVGGAIAGAVALGVEHLVLEPVKRRVAVSERVRIRGTLAHGYAKGEVAWTRPDGSTVRTRVGDTAIAFETPPLGQGIHRIEILGVGPSGLEVLANMPVACGVALPAPAAPAAPVDESNPKAALLELVNRERRNAGVPALEIDPTLDEVAEGHSKDMVDHHFFGHQSPTTGVVDDRLRAAGLRLGLFGENVAKGPSMAEAHSMLCSSPAHRANVLNPRFTDVGIGVVAERASDPPLYAVTEVFAGFPAPIENLEVIATAAFSTLNRAREQARIPALVRAPALDGAAREIASAVAAAPAESPLAIGEPVIRKRLSGTRHRHPLLLTGFTLDPNELAGDDRLKASNVRAAGVAVAQAPGGPRPTTNVVVFLLSE